jgi:DNA repair protein RadB
VQYLATGCPPLDALLDGGLERDAITLVFGEGGSGKTNLALQCAREAARKGLRIAYVDTEGVSSVRLRQVFGDDAELEGRVLFFTPYTIEEQERLVQNATRVPELGLVVVDSINMHYRLHIDGGEEAEKEAARSLYKQLHHLTGFARQGQVPVLVTGQVYGGEDTTQPFARRVMEHLVKALIRFEKRPDGTRRATVIKHRSIEEGRMARFRITTQGLVAAEPIPAS